MPDRAAGAGPPVKTVGPVTSLALVFAALGDWIIVALMVAVSGFLFGTGPESQQWGPLGLFLYSAFGFFALTAPLIGFFLRQRSPTLAVFVATLPILVAVAVFAATALIEPE